VENIEKLKFPIGRFAIPTFIDQPLIDAWIADIDAFPARLKALVYGLSAEQLNWRYRPGGWNIKQVVHHCADSHINSFVRFKLTLTEDRPTVKPYDEGKWAELVDATDDDISASLLLIEGLHARWAKLLRSLSLVDLERQFVHPEHAKDFSLKDIVAMYAWHSNHHLAHVAQALFSKGAFNEDDIGQERAQR